MHANKYIKIFFFENKKASTSPQKYQLKLGLYFDSKFLSLGLQCYRFCNSVLHIWLRVKFRDSNIISTIGTIMSIYYCWGGLVYIVQLYIKQYTCTDLFLKRKGFKFHCGMMKSKLISIQNFFYVSMHSLFTYFNYFLYI